MLNATVSAVNTWVIFQSFDWASLSNRGNVYTNIGNMASSLASAGIDAVWFPPPSQSVDKEGYLPQQWYLLESESNLKAAISKVKGANMAAIADVVVNHRTAPSIDSCTGHYTKFANPDFGSWAVTKDDENCNGNSCCGAQDTGDHVTYAPDLDHTNSAVRSGIKDYLSFLKGYGFSSWRFDMVVGYSASYAGEYISASSPTFSVGEYWDSSTSKVVNWINGAGGKSQAFDFPLRYTLQAAIKSNSYSSMGYLVPGVVGQNPSHAVTFIDNHDTSRDDRFGSTDQIILGYVYILTHPGTPCVYYSDWQSSSIQSAIKNVLSARTSKGITSTSAVYIEKFTSGLYAAVINDNLAMKIGTSSWTPSDESFKLHTSGTNYAVWTK